MVDALQDEERNFYLRQLGVTEGNKKDLELRFYRSVTGDSSNNLALQQKLWFASLGITQGAVHDMWKQYLTSLGYTGDVPFMRRKFYNEN